MELILKILGTGCPKCKALESKVREVISENNISATVQKVEDMMDIMNYGVMRTPALVVNEKIVLSGRLPSKDEILNFIKGTH
jgi:small redox-active disulfide protein 2